MNKEKYLKSQFKGRIKEAVKLADSLRSDPTNPQDVSFQEIAKEKFSTSFDNLLNDLGINPQITTIQNIFSVDDEDIRWVIPEIIREALVLGYRNAPIWPNITAAEETIMGTSQIMPYLNMSEATPARVNEGETIPLGTISYGQKKVEIFKIGRGIKIPYEVSQYCSLNVVSIYLRDFGIKLGHAMDVLAINTLINGEQTDGSESAAVVGIG